MKKIMYIIYLIFGKTLGRFWIFAALPFVDYGNSVTFNYVLQNGLPYKRLMERNPTWDAAANGWRLDDVHGLASHHGLRGFIKYRKVSKLQFYLVAFFVSGWTDPDCTEGFTDIGYINTIKVGATGYRTGKVDRSKNILFWYRRWLPEFKEGDVVFGSAFDLGDVRGQYSFLDAKFTRTQKFFCIYSWAARNPAMGFQYIFFNY